MLLRLLRHKQLSNYYTIHEKNVLSRAMDGRDFLSSYLAPSGGFVENSDSIYANR